MSEDWREAAICAQVDPALWFPEKGERNDAAKRICAICEVQAECLDFAFENGEEYGVWGGLTAFERRPSQAPPTYECAICGVSVKYSGFGGPEKYCSDKCRLAGRRYTQAAYDERKRAA